MPLSAWLMLVFGCAILYGGLAWCISIAARQRGRNVNAPTESPSPAGPEDR